jgi:hypothetical protein
MLFLYGVKKPYFNRFFHGSLCPPSGLALLSAENGNPLYTASAV